MWECSLNRQSLGWRQSCAVFYLFLHVCSTSCHDFLQRFSMFCHSQEVSCEIRELCSFAPKQLDVVWTSGVRDFIRCFGFSQVTTPSTSACTCPRATGVGGATAGEPATRTGRRSWWRTPLTSRTQKTTTRPATASSNLSVSSDGLHVKAG